jgi:hypothetical protein
MAFEGADIIGIAMQHIGERYVLGARAPLNNPDHRGPWDCAEFTSWCAFQVYGMVFGCFGQNPATADPFSGKWFDDGVAQNCLVPVGSAIATPGAFLVRKPGDFNIGIGHVAISMGDGRTVEAHSANTGVLTKAGAASRSWTSGLHLPGVQYAQGQQPAAHNPVAGLLRVTNPFIRGDAVRLVQLVLQRRGFMLSEVDGIYGQETAAAVANFQLTSGFLVDGEVGPDTANALGVGWPIDTSLLSTFET